MLANNNISIKDDHEDIFMNKQEFRDISHQSPINFYNIKNKKRMQTTFFPNHRASSNPNTERQQFTPFIIDSNNNNQLHQISKNNQSSTFYPRNSCDVNKTQIFKQQIIQKNFNKQMHLKKGVQFRNIALDKLAQNITQANNDSEILKITQKRINNQNSSFDQPDDPSSQAINSSLIVFKRKKTNILDGGQQNISTFNQHQYPYSSLGHSRISSGSNDENVNNILFISTDTSTQITSRQKKKNFSIQPINNYVNQLTTNNEKTRPTPLDIYKNQKFLNQYVNMNNNSKLFDKQNQNILNQQENQILQNAHNLIYQDTSLNGFSNQTHIQPFYDMQSQEEQINSSLNNSPFYTQNSLHVQKRKLINFISNQSNNLKPLTKNQNPNIYQSQHQSSSIKSTEETPQQKQNIQNSQFNTPLKTGENFPLQNIGFQTIKQRAISPKDTLAKIKNKQNIQEICLTYKKEDQPIQKQQPLFNPQSSLKTDIIRKLQRDSERKKSNMLINSRGFPYQIQFEQKSQKSQLENIYNLDNERLESWGVDHRQETLFGVESFPTHHDYEK
ncbi:hypothetical protein ABPG74_003575 [Tetrahymena malaccensis]